MTKKILVVVDAQNDFITGALGNKECDVATNVIAEEIRSGKYFISEPLLYMQLKYLFNLLVRNYKAIFFVLTFEIPTSFSCINAIYSGNCIYAACE